MKTIVHKANSRGSADHGWLKAHHSFSFAGWFNPNRVHFGALRVLNDDIIAPKMGFGTHPHDNMEIITIPLKGVLKHRDNMHDDWQSVLPSEVQVMSAGTGVKHSEINGSTSEDLSLFQIWIIPNERSVKPRYDQKTFKSEDRKNNLQVLVSSFEDPHQGSLKIHQDARLSRIDLSENSHLEYKLKSKEYGVYMMAISGNVEVGNDSLSSRDAIAVSESAGFSVKATSTSQLLFIEVPMISI